MKPPKTKGTREPIKEGAQIAICSMIAEIGTQVVPKYKCPGEFEEKYQVRISFDFPKDRIEFTDDNDQTTSKPKRKTPFAFNFSYHKKSKLGIMLNTWTGSLPNNDFDLLEMLGKPAIVTIGHKDGGEGKVYDEIVSVTQLIDGMEVPTAENAPIGYAMSRDFKNIPDGLPDFIVEEIQKSKEWEMMADATAKIENVAGTTMDDDCPF